MRWWAVAGLSTSAAAVPSSRRLRGTLGFHVVPTDRSGKAIQANPNCQPHPCAWLQPALSSDPIRSFKQCFIQNLQAAQDRVAHC